MHGKDRTEAPEVGKSRNKIENVPRREAYSVDEVAFLLGGVTPRFVWTLVDTGDIPSFKLGSRRLVRHDALHAYIDGLTAEAARVRATTRKDAVAA